MARARLLLRVRTDVEAARAHDPVERILLDARLEQPLATALLIAARAERPDVERLGLRARRSSAGSSNLSSWVRTTIAVW